MSEKKWSLEEALKNIEKQFWKWTVITLWENKNIWAVNTMHSGSYILDLILWWWYPQWRIIEIFWPESSWKTTLALHAIASVQKKWEIAAFIDAEHALDPDYARSIWVDTDKLLVSQPDYWEQALQVAEELAKSWEVRLVVIDSVAAMVPKAEVEWDMWDSFMWLQARMMSQWLRKITSILWKTWTTVIFLNQIRMKIWIMFWNPETTSWWNALKFFASQRIDIRRWDKIENNKEQIWYLAKIKIVKNKIAPPFKTCDLMIKFNRWIDSINDIIESWLLLWLISRNWAFYSFANNKFQWREKLVNFILSDDKSFSNLATQIQEELKQIRAWKKVIIEWNSDDSDEE